MIYNMIGGGANQLNFKVVGSATEPSNPAENTIWVQTSISLTTVEFSDQQVSPSWAMPAGFCYISIDGGYWSSDYDARPSFGLVHKEKLIVYVKPKAAYLNTDGTASGWASVNAYIYKSGAWVQFSSAFAATIRITYPAGSGSHVEGPNGYYAQSPDTSGYWEVTVPAAGDYLVCTDDSTTGQGVQKAVSITEDGQSVDVTLSYVLSLTSDYFNRGLSLSGYNNTSSAVSKFSCTKKAIDLTNFSTLSATLFANSASIYIKLYISTTTSKNNAVASAGMPGPNSSGSSRRIDISRFSGEYYIILEVVCNGYTYDTKTGGAKDIILT